MTLPTATQAQENDQKRQNHSEARQQEREGKLLNALRDTLLGDKAAEAVALQLLEEARPHKGGMRGFVNKALNHPQCAGNLRKALLNAAEALIEVIEYGRREDLVRRGVVPRQVAAVGGEQACVIGEPGPLHVRRCARAAYDRFRTARGERRDR